MEESGGVEPLRVTAPWFSRPVAAHRSSALLAESQSEPDDDIVVSFAYPAVRFLAFGADPRSRASDLPGFNRALLPPELGRRRTRSSLS